MTFERLVNRKTVIYRLTGSVDLGCFRVLLGTCLLMKRVLGTPQNHDFGRFRGKIIDFSTKMTDFGLLGPLKSVSNPSGSLEKPLQY